MDIFWKLFLFSSIFLLIGYFVMLMANFSVVGLVILVWYVLLVVLNVTVGSRVAKVELALKHLTNKLK